MALQMSNTYVKSKINTYKDNEVLAATPGELVLMLYDQAILACKTANQAKASTALAELVNSLNFDYEISAGLFRLYDYGIRMVKKDQFDEVTTILVELRQAWKKALESLQAA